MLVGGGCDWLVCIAGLVVAEVGNGSSVAFEAVAVVVVELLE